MIKVENNVNRSNFIVTIVLLALLSFLLIFHLLILRRVIPFDLIWGGKLKDSSQMFFAFFNVPSTLSLLSLPDKSGQVMTNN
jgi:hypothetical protein